MGGGVGVGAGASRQGEWRQMPPLHFGLGGLIFDIVGDLFLGGHMAENYLNTQYNEMQCKI